MKTSKERRITQRTDSIRFSTLQAVIAFITVMMMFHPWFLRAETPGPSVLRSRVLEPGDEYIHGFIRHGGYLWASTRTNPCRILRVDPETLEYGRIVLHESYNEGEDLVAAEGWVWVILYGTPSRLIRVNPDSLTWETAVSFEAEEFTRGGSLTYAFGFLWAGGGDGKIARIHPVSLDCDVFDFSTALGRLQVHALTSGNGYLWASSPIFSASETERDESIVLRINPRNPREYAAVFLQDTPVSDDLVFTGNRLYAAGESSQPGLYRIDVDLTYDRLAPGVAGYLGCGALGHTLWGTLSGMPGKLVRVDADLHECHIYTLPPGFNHANEIVFDPENDALFVTTWDSPARILKMTIPGGSDPLLKERLFARID